MTSQELVEIIKSRGYWQIRVTPEKYDSRLISSREQLISIVESAQVRLRGWYYPHIADWNQNNTRTPRIVNNYIEGGSNWGAYKEFWRFTQSGQFIHIFAMTEDYIQEDLGRSSVSHIKEFKPGDVLDTGSVIYGVSEIFAFIGGLSRHGLYDSGVKIEITLIGTQGRVLEVFDPMKVGLFMAYKCDTPSISWNENFAKEEITKDYKKIALEAIDWIFESFNWMNRPKGVFETDQQKLFERRL